MPSKGDNGKAKRGVTLIEVMLAGSITAMLVLVLLETLIFGARIAKENSQYLAADAYAFDVAWRHCNEAFDNMPSTLTRQSYNIASNAAPEISLATWQAAKCYVTVTNANRGKIISVDVEWGPTGHRKHLSNYHPTEIFKCRLERSAQ